MKSDSSVPPNDRDSAGFPAPKVYDRKEHGISRRYLDPDALKIMYRLINSGHKGYLVGGGVRDLLLGKRPKDYDIATDATPRRIKSLFRNSRIIGRRFKLVHIFFGRAKIIEVATFRAATDPLEMDDEDEESSLQQDNQFGSEATDAYRRDITINGLFYDPQSFSVIDYVGGMEDIRQGVIRVIGNPDQRFREDPVRMIRALRHAARTGFKIEPEVWESIRRNRELIRVCPPMRLYEELKKDFVSGNLSPTLPLMAQSDLLELVLPELLHNFPAVVNASSHISKCIQRIDDFQRKKAPLSAALILSCISASLDDASFRSGVLTETLQDEAERHRFLSSTFKLLQVTRRDREQIADIFSCWSALSGNESSRLRRMLEQPEERDTLEIFLGLIDSPLRENLEVLQLEDLPEDEPAPRKKRRRRRRKGSAAAS